MVDKAKDTERETKLSQRAQDYFGKVPEDLSPNEAKVFDRIFHRKPVAQNTNAAFDAKSTFGERLADGVAAFGGSWKFICIFGAVLLLWVSGNSIFGGGAFDPYPFIFLNLVLSMLAAVQAPIIMMSQNRQSSRDRLDATHDYQVNLKSEIEIMALHDKLDAMRNDDLRALIAQQQTQIEMLQSLIKQLSDQVKR